MGGNLLMSDFWYYQQYGRTATPKDFFIIAGLLVVLAVAAFISNRLEKRKRHNTDTYR